MKCAEVIEWMHRYLDHDLSREEITEMFRHIDHCLPCAEIFDRLTMLSRQLEQLPDVKAPFSLVDSILPRLDELDRGLIESEKSGSGEEVAVPFSRTISQGKRQKGSSMARRTGIGAVAAAIILGIAIFNMPEQIPGAQVEEMVMKSTSNNAATESGAAGMMNSNTADTAANSGLEQNSPASDSGLTESRIEESAVPEISAAESPKGGTETPEPTTGNASGGDSAKSIAPQTTNNKSPKHQATATPSRQDFGISSTQPDGSGQNSTENSNSTEAGPAAKESFQPKVGNEQGIMGIFPAAPASGELSWTSPDGQYEAAVEDQQLVIYSLPASGLGVDKMPVASLPLEGNWMSGEWSPDSLQFIYVTDNNGIAVQKVYSTPEAGTSSAVPSSTPVPARENSASNTSAATSSTK
ncbi:zf-HC2 domain-containing protein [Paenibacillus sp. BR2-3]|uniref:anti-sigma factor family protein n=1 Tax=Paenibacillus sp. BR2-3 TaxID=3048494 RepID=UPI0039779984